MPRLRRYALSALLGLFAPMGIMCAVYLMSGDPGAALSFGTLACMVERSMKALADASYDIQAWWTHRRAASE